MKHIYLFSLLILFPLGTYSQDYIPILGDSNIWYIFNYSEGYYTDINSFIYTRDTIVEGKHYNLYNYSWLIREDTISKQVFWLHKGYEIILYDFSLNTGDSILLEEWCGQPSPCSGYYSIVSTSIINTLSGNRKAIYLKGKPDGWADTQYPIWIEGIGSLAGFGGNLIGPSWNYQLLCYYKDGEFIYKSDMAMDSNTCEIYGPSTVEIVNKEKMDIYPNPFNNQLIISGLPDTMLSIEIYDIYGRKLIYKNIQPNNSYTINTTGFKSGLYVLRIYSKTKNLIVLNKIIVKR